MAVPDFIVPDVTPRVQYVATAAQTAFAIPYRFFDGDDIEVLIDDDITPISDALYTIVGDGLNSNGTLTFLVGRTAGTIVTIYRNSTIDRLVNFQNSGEWTAKNVNDQLNRLTMFIQEIALRANQLSVMLPINTQLDSIVFPDYGAALNADRLISWSPDGTTLITGPTVTELETVFDSIGDINIVSANIADIETVANNLNGANTIGTVSTNITNVNSVGGSIANVNAVAGNAANINTVAARSANIITLAAISGNITTVAGISGNVTTVAGISAAVSTVAAANANITVVSTNIANINTVAGISANVTSVAGNSVNINAVNANSANINTVAGNSANINTVAGISANVTTVAGANAAIGTVSTNIAAVNTASTNIAAIIAAPASATAAYNWAMYPANTLVPQGNMVNEYSAYHWALQAAAVVGGTMAALSVKANATNAVAAPTDVVAATDGQVFRRSGTTLGFGALDLAAAAAITGRIPYTNQPQVTALSVTGNGTNATADESALAAGTDGHVLRRSGTTLGFGTINLAAAGTVGTSRLGVANLLQLPALSVIGNATNATSNMASIAAATDGNVLRRSGTAIGFGTIDLASAGAVTGTLPVARGGTGLITNVAYAPIVGGTAANGPLQSLASAGTAGQVLKSNGAAALPSFQDQGASGWVPIKTVTAAASTAIDFVHGSGGVVLDGTYKTYAVVISSLVPNTNVSHCYLRTSANAGVSYGAGASEYAMTGNYYNAGTRGDIYNASNTEISLHNNSGANSNAAGSSFNAVLYFHNLSIAGLKSHVEFVASYNFYNAAELAGSQGNAQVNTAQVDNAIRFLCSSGNWTSGTITLYGLAQ